jgi:hypothetical protein
LQAQQRLRRIAATQKLVRWLGVASRKFYDGRARYGKVNEPNGGVPRDFGLETWEKRAILDSSTAFRGKATGG